MRAKHHPIKNNSLKRKRCGHNSLIMVKDYSTNNEYSWFDYNHKLKQAVTPTDTLKFAYDALGNRNLKPKENKDSLFYVNDLQGNIMATYKLKNDSLYLVDQPLYGSSRLGTETMSRLLWQRDTNVYYSNALYSTVRGNKQYEIANHLGNVLATVSDKKVGVDSTGDGVYDYYEPVEITATDYYAYGGELPERTYTNSIGEYPFGYNTQMKVNEISPTHYYAPFWEYDTRLGANGRLNRDPKPVAWESPYMVNRSNPIWYNDQRGDSAIVLSAPTGAKEAGHMAILIQDDKNKWSLYSKNGTHGLGGAYGKTPRNTSQDKDEKAPQYGEGKFDTPEDFFKSDLNPVINKKTDERLYSEGYLIPMTKAQDKAAEAGARQELNKKNYNVIGSNCACMVQTALSKAGKKDGSQSLLKRIISPFLLQMINEKVPNLIYQRIKKQNPNGYVITPNGSNNENGN